jgi:hypothetical protein
MMVLEPSSDKRISIIFVKYQKSSLVPEAKQCSTNDETSKQHNFWTQVWIHEKEISLLEKVETQCPAIMLY